jgi:cytochrome P450 family 6
MLLAGKLDSDMEIPPLESWWAITTFLLGGVILLYMYLTRTHSYWRKRGVPYVKPLPLFGNLMDIMLVRKPFGMVFHDLYR